jgi:DNA-binding NarL/FixJ family response regulator
MIRLLIVDDRPAVRRGLKMCLEIEPDITIVGEAGDGKTALALVQILHPDVVLMDVAMPEMDGLATTTALRVLEPLASVVIHTVHDDAATRERALAAGAVAIVAKRRCGEDLAPAIREAAAGSSLGGFGGP